MRALVIGAACLLTALSSSAEGQGRSTSDIVSGVVIGPDSVPIARAEVRVRTEDGRTQPTMTDLAGKYRVVVDRNGSFYEVAVRAFGYVPFVSVLAMPVKSGELRRDIRLSAIAVPLPPVRVVATDLRRERQSPAEQSARWSTFLSEQYPVDASDTREVATLTAGVLRVGPTGDLSIAGQSPSQNRATVDGASHDAGALPTEAVRSAGVVANTFDVARGQFSGGQLISTTIAGTNNWGGAFSVRSMEPTLALGARNALQAGRARTYRMSAGGGGPLRTDRLFVFGALDVVHTDAQRSGLASLNGVALDKAGVPADSVQKFMDVARNFGLVGSSNSVNLSPNQGLSSLGRVDVNIAEHQSATARVNWGSSVTEAQASPLLLPVGAATTRTNEAGALVQLTSSWQRWGNELRVQRSVNESRSERGVFLPGGSVRIVGTPDSLSGASVIGFGGLGAPAEQNGALVELSDDLVFSTEDDAHRLKAGVLAQQRSAIDYQVAGSPGEFSFNSLGDLASNRPSTFTRELSGSVTAPMVQRTFGAYVGDIWRPDSLVSVVFGLRLDGATYANRSMSSALQVNEWPGRANPRADVVLSPRVGFNIESAGNGRWTVNGGIGRFVGLVAPGSLAQAWSETGDGVSTLVCEGPATPVPDWPRFLADTAAIPRACEGGASTFALHAPNATLFSDSFAAPSTWRGSLGGSWRLAPHWGLWLDGLYVLGTRIASDVDANFAKNPMFALPGEGNRPVFASATAVDSSTGVIAPKASRLDATLGVVRVLGSEARSRTMTINAQIVGTLGRAVNLSLFYTYTRSRLYGTGTPTRESSFATTAGDPTTPEWTDSPLQPRHALQLMSSIRVNKQTTIAAIARVRSGQPFTPLVRGDVNGDGFENDRAFVFDPSRVNDSLLARTLTDLIEGPGSPFGECLRSQIGTIARAGSCTTSWVPSLDLRAQWIAVGDINSRRLVISLTASNVVAGLDYLAHGPDRMRGWGQYPTPDATLLTVRGFDTQRSAFLYQANPHFGQPLQGGVLWQPFRVVVQARVALGEDPAYQPMLHAVQLGLGMSDQKMRTTLATRVLNVPQTLLSIAMKDSGALSLTLPQRAQLEQGARALAPQIDVAVDSLAALLTLHGPMTALRMARIQENATRARNLVTSGLQLTKDTLTPEQWATLPRWLLATPEMTAITRVEGTMTVMDQFP